MDTFSAIRRMARSLLEEYEWLARKPAMTADHGSYAVLEDLAFRCCHGLTVAKNPSLEDGVLGLLDVENSVISINCSLSPERYAFTVAHEIGHSALGHQPRITPDTSNDINEEPDYSALTVQNGVYRAYDERDRIELEANVFAAELLAPAELVRERVLGNPDWAVEDLSKYFGLSRSAMLNQLVFALLPGKIERLEDEKVFEEVELDPNQRAAVEVETPALVVAGPGAGKTRILVNRFVKLVRDGTAPQRILALTFANKAAQEMRDRLSQSLPEQAHEITVSTFHSFGLDLLKGYGQHVGLKHPLKLLTPLDAFALVKKRLAAMPMGVFEDLRQPARNLKILFDAVSRAKDELVTPAGYLELAEKWQTQIQSVQSPGEAQDADALKKDLEEAARCLDAARFFAAYQDLLHDEGAVDYGDLIAEAVRLLNLPEVGDAIRSQYDHILVDEFQDINYASGRLLQGLDGGRGIVWVVGDSKQSIYRFRGASPGNLLGFLDDYSGAKVVALDLNYRSVEDIVECGHAVHIPIRSDGKTVEVPKLISHRGRLSDVPAVSVVTAPDGEAELSELVLEVSGLSMTYQKEDIAVLCRTRAQAQLISDRLERAGLATTWSGAIQERAAFKDIMGVLYLACGDMRGLVRLAEVSEHRIDTQDLRLLTRWSAENIASALKVLHAASEGRIDGLSPECVSQSKKLKCLADELRAQPTAFHSITKYLFERAGWCRELVHLDTPESRQTLSTLGQICNLARSFVSQNGNEGTTTVLPFVEYLESCVEAGELVVPLGDTVDVDAINVMTVHGSKGLQWRVVLIPFLVERKFPNESPHEKIPIPPGLIRGEDANDNDIEEACLFYVAATRAQDQLILMHSEKYGRAAHPSIFVDQVMSGLLDKGYVSMRTARSEASQVSETANDSEVSYSFDGKVRFSALRAYKSCPKRFEFQHILGLRDNDTGYRDFYMAIYAAMQILADEAATGHRPSAETAVSILDREWVARGPIGHWYEQRYRSSAEQLVVDFADRLRPGIPVKLRQELVLKSIDREVVVTVDEIEEGETTVLRWHKYGRLAKSHEKDDMPALMTALAQHYYPGVDHEVRLHYPLVGHDAPVAPTPKVVGNRVKKMAELAAEAEKGPYLPKNSTFTCKSCFYALICPSGVDEEN